ncbi:hypothetical protein BH23CHL5_BH23CHL5_02850 [soil metagenome]
MLRRTHLAVAAIAVAPLTFDLSLAASGGIVLMGLAGAVVPDYLDLHSDARQLMRHRGVSHGVAAGLIVAVLCFAIMRALSRIDDASVQLPAEHVEPLTFAFGIGLLSHLALDACTPHGIKPGLPFTNRRLRLLPRSMRIRTGGAIDRLLGTGAIAIAIAFAAARLLGLR